MSYLKIIIFLIVLSLIGCSSNYNYKNIKTKENPFYGGAYKIGDPYLVEGKIYYPKVNNNYNETGVASWYGKKFHKKATANGEVFDMYKVSAAHKTLPLPSRVRVTNLENKKSIILRVNDRGPFAKNRIIDLSMRAAEILGFKDQGTAQVRVEFYSNANVYDKSGRLIPKKEFLKNNQINRIKNKNMNSKESYLLLIGSFQKKKNIENIKRKLSGFGKLKIEKKENDGVEIFKIYIGPYFRKEYLEKLQKTIEVIGIPGTKIALND